MATIRMYEGERLLADVSPSRSTVVFPVLEMLLITGLAWLAVGWIDSQAAARAVDLLGYELYPPSALVAAFPNDRWAQIYLWGHRLVLVLWAIGLWRRGIRHMIFRQRSRMVLTTQRLVTASGGWRSRTGEVPLAHVVDARRKGSSVAVYLRTSSVPVVLRNVPASKQFTHLLREQLPYAH